MTRPLLKPPETIFENAFLSLYSVVADFGAFTREYFVVDTGLRCGVIAVVDDQVLLTRQYRLVPDGPAWEIPGGRADEGEKAVDAAAREFREETGYACHKLRPLLKYEAGLDTRRNPTELFWTDRVERVGNPEHETDGARWVPYGECLQMVASGEIIDVFTITALQAYELQIRRAESGGRPGSCPTRFAGRGKGG